MATFGHLACDGATFSDVSSVASHITGSHFTLTECADVTKITACLLWFNVLAGVEGKCAIYDDVAGVPTNLMGQTLEYTFPFSFIWQHYDFLYAAPLRLLPAEYWIVAWARIPSNHIRLRGTTAGVNKGVNRVSNYPLAGTPYPNPFPAPAGFYTNIEYSIYATYTPCPVGGKQFKGDGLAWLVMNKS